jgi:hypothetical protein
MSDETEKRVILYSLVGIIVLCILCMIFGSTDQQEFQILSIIVTLCTAKLGTITDFHWGNSKKREEK